MSSRIIPGCDPDNSKWRQLKNLFEKWSPAPNWNANINAPHKSFWSRALKEQNTIDLFCHSPSCCALPANPKQHIMQQEAGYRLSGSAGYDWLFNELLAILKFHCKAGIIHAKVSALFLEVHSLGWNSGLYGQCGSYIAAGTLQKRVFEKGLGNWFDFSRKTGCHSDTSAIIKQILTWLESIPSKLLRVFSDFFFQYELVIINFLLFQSTDEERETERRLQNCVAYSMILKTALVIIVYVTD